MKNMLKSASKNIIPGPRYYFFENRDLPVITVALMEFITENFENIISRQRFSKKVRPAGQLFGWVWRLHTIRGAHGGRAHFPAESGSKNQKLTINIATQISYYQSIDNSLLNFHKELQPNWQEMAELWPNNVCPNMGMCANFWP